MAAGGLPATVYRPGIVVGDSRTGETQKADGPYGVVRWLLRWPRVAPVPLFGDADAHRVNLVPRDFVVGALGVVEAFRMTQINQAATFNGTYYLVAATLFVAITIPLARFTDWLVSRERDRRYAASVAAGSKAARRGRLLGFGR